MIFTYFHLFYCDRAVGSKHHTPLDRRDHFYTESQNPLAFGPCACTQSHPATTWQIFLEKLLITSYISPEHTKLNHHPLTSSFYVSIPATTLWTLQPLVSSQITCLTLNWLKTLFWLSNCLSNCEFKLLTGFDQFTQDKTMKICVKELLWFSHFENEFK